ncbi:MAG: DUF554 family protein [Ornithinimicrobium sp.]
MDALFTGLGTVINVVAIVLGAAVGLVLGHRLPEHVKHVVTDALGLVTLLVAALSAYEVTSPALVDAVGVGVPVLVVLGSLLVGGIVGALARIEDRLAALAGQVQRLAARGAPMPDPPAPGAQDPDNISPRERFIEGWLTTSLLFCVGPLAILGSLSDGLGRGIDQLVLKSGLDLFAAMAFAASFGLGVMFSAVSVAVIQGLLTAVGFGLGAVISEAQVAALTCVGGLLLVGLALRLLRVRDVPVANLLPSLIVAPLLVALIAGLR